LNEKLNDLRVDGKLGNCAISLKSQKSSRNFGGNLGSIVSLHDEQQMWINDEGSSGKNESGFFSHPKIVSCKRCSNCGKNCKLLELQSRNVKCRGKVGRVGKLLLWQSKYDKVGGNSAIEFKWL
jgi:hypothetical protein